MSYRPICDVWILARPKLKNGQRYYGSYPGGFLERARRVLGVGWNDSVLHVCSGKVREYPYAGGIGPNDKTFDLDAALLPDYCGDVRKLDAWPWRGVHVGAVDNGAGVGWPAILMDPPYTTQDATHYLPGLGNFPKPLTLMRHAAQRVAIGGKIGLLHYEWPGQAAGLREIGVYPVLTGRRQRARVFTVWERLA